MPRLEDVHKESVKKFGEDPLTEKGEQRHRRVLGQLAWAALSRADLSFPISFLSRFQAKPNPAVPASTPPTVGFTVPPTGFPPMATVGSHPMPPSWCICNCRWNCSNHGWTYTYHADGVSTASSGSVYNSHNSGMWTTRLP